MMDDMVVHHGGVPAALTSGVVLTAFGTTRKTNAKAPGTTRARKQVKKQAGRAAKTAKKELPKKGPESG